MHRSTWLGVLCVVALLAIAGGGLSFPHREPKQVTPLAPASAPAPARRLAAAEPIAARAPDAATTIAAAPVTDLIGPPAPTESFAGETPIGPPAPESDEIAATRIGPPAVVETSAPVWCGPPAELAETFDPFGPPEPEPAPAAPAALLRRLPAERALTAVAPAPPVTTPPANAPRPWTPLLRAALDRFGTGRAAALACFTGTPPLAVGAAAGAIACALIALVTWHVHSRRDRMFRAFARGKSVAEIARRNRMAQDGVRTLLRAGATAHGTTRRQLLPVGRIVRTVSHVIPTHPRVVSPAGGMGYELVRDRAPRGTPVA